MSDETEKELKPESDPVLLATPAEINVGEGIQDSTLLSVITSLKSILSNADLYRQLLRCELSDAQKVVDFFQRLLDTPGLDLRFRLSLITAMQRIAAANSGVYPQVYLLNDIEYDQYSPIAAGGFSDVYKGRFRQQVVCLKMFRIYQTSDIGNIFNKTLRHALLWGQLAHPNILPFYGIVQLNNRIGIVSPWMENGDVRSYLAFHPDASRLKLAADVAIGLAYLHEIGLVHGDINGSNVLVDLSGRALLDLSHVSSIIDTFILKWSSMSAGASRGGTSRWQAPELFDTSDEGLVVNTRETDVYAWGCVCFEIFTDTIPFSNLKSEVSVIHNVLSGSRPARPEASLALGLTDDIWSLMQHCWRSIPHDRPSSKEIVERISSNLTEYWPLGPNELLSSAEFRRQMSDRVKILDNDAFSRTLHHIINFPDEPAESGPPEKPKPTPILEMIALENHPFDEEPIQVVEDNDGSASSKSHIVAQMNSKDIVIAVVGTLAAERRRSFLADALDDKAREDGRSPHVHFCVAPHPGTSGQNIYFAYPPDPKEQTFMESLNNISDWISHSCSDDRKMTGLIYLAESSTDPTTELSSHASVLNKYVEASSTVIAVICSNFIPPAPFDQHDKRAKIRCRICQLSSWSPPLSKSHDQHSYTPGDIINIILGATARLAKHTEGEPPEDFYMDDPRDTDIVIPIIGAVGAGKSTFINFVTHQDTATGSRRVIFKTTQVQSMILPHLNDLSRRIILVDTPGFDDSHLTYFEFWRRIAIWLAHSYSSNKNLGGFIYLRDINEPTSLDTAQKHLHRFNILVGRDASKSVVLATTKWSHIAQSVGVDREKQLQEHEWKDIIKLGATYFRFTDSHECGQAFLRHIIMKAEPESQLPDTRIQSTTFGVVSRLHQNINVDFGKLFLPFLWKLLLFLPFWTAAHADHLLDQTDNLNIEELSGRLALVFEDAHQCKLLLSCRNSEAQALLDTFQLILNARPSDPKLRRNLIIGIRKLSTKTNIYPSLFYLSKLDHIDEWPEAGGMYGDIHKGVYHGRDVCVKSIKVYASVKPEQTVKMIAREAVLWGQLSHPNLLPFYGLYLYKDRLALISPWARNGTLSEFLRKNSTASRLLLCSDIAEGIWYLHDNDMIHGDLKGINVLIDASHRAYLADFGLSAVDDKDVLAWSRNITAMTGGTLRWQAPELFPLDTQEEATSTGIPNTKATDIYAFAFVCYEIFTGLTPFPKLPDIHVMIRVKAGHRPALPTRLKQPGHGPTPGEVLSDELRALIQDCWHGDPAMRPDIAQVRSRLAPLLPEDQRPPGEWRDEWVSLQGKKIVTDVPLTLTMLDEILGRPLPLDEHEAGMSEIPETKVDSLFNGDG